MYDEHWRPLGRVSMQPGLGAILSPQEDIIRTLAVGFRQSTAE